MMESQEPRDEREENNEDSSNDMDWLEELANENLSDHQVSDTEGAMNPEDLPADGAGDEIPDWLKADLEKEITIDEEIPDWLVPELGVEGSENSSENQAKDVTRLEGASASADANDETLIAGKSAFADAEDEVLDWLEEMAEVEALEGDDQSTETALVLESNDVDSLEDTDSITIKEDVPENMIDHFPMDESVAEVADAEDTSEALTDVEVAPLEADGVEGDETLLADVPEDPDEAMAWLESLAAAKGAPHDELLSAYEAEEIDSGGAEDLVAFEEELKTDNSSIAEPSEIESDVSVIPEQETYVSEDLTDVDIEDTIVSKAINIDDLSGTAHSPVEPSDADTGAEVIPDDPDEAMAWLEQLAADRGSVEVEPSDESIVEVSSDSQIDVEEMVDDSVSEAPEEADLMGDLDEALDWLEQMVAIDQEKAPESIDYSDEEAVPDILEDQALAAESFEVESVSETQAISESAAMVEPEEDEPETAEAFAWLDHLAEAESDLPYDIDLEDEDESVDKAEIAESSEALIGQPLEPSFAQTEELSPMDAAKETADDLTWLELTEESEAAQETDEILEKTAPESTDESTYDSEPGIVLEETHLAEESEQDGLVKAEMGWAGANIEQLLSIEGQKQLQMARSAFEAGDVDQALREYDSLLEDSSSLPVVISDLEASANHEEKQVLIQRTLGDAYVRNGQLKKAIEVYRKALSAL